MADEEVYEEEQFEEEMEGEESLPPEEDEESTLGAALHSQMKAAPWYVGSVAVHLAVFLILMLIPVEHRQKKKKRIVITTQMEEEQPEEMLEEEIEPDIQENEVVETTDVADTPVVTPDVQTEVDVEISAEIETEDNSDAPMDDSTEMSDIGEDDFIEPALMGVAGSRSGRGGGGKLGFRSGGGKRRALRKGGGDKKTESSVDWALRWLAAHQERDGSWNVLKLEGGGHGTQDHAPTALALLAFLGAGNSTRFGKYKLNVRRAVDWLLKEQQPDGRVGRHRYEAGITLMALAEAYGMSGESRLKEAAQKAVDYAAATQCPAGGWDYAPSNAHRVDTSPTGWWVMGLKSAKVSELHVPRDTFMKALEYFEAGTTMEGKCLYAASGGKDNPNKIIGIPEVKANAGKGSIRMASVALCCLQFLGRPRDDPKVLACAQHVTSDNQLPDPRRMAKGSRIAEEHQGEGVHFDFYLWYYNALGLFQLGVRHELWRKFNPEMKEVLLKTQVRKGSFRGKKGSWDPYYDAWGESWGRVGQTAIGALMLEVYYRYQDVHKHGAAL